MFSIYKTQCEQTRHILESACGALSSEYLKMVRLTMANALPVWKTPAREALTLIDNQWNQGRDAIDETWRLQRDWIDFASAAQSISGLSSINTDIANELWRTGLDQAQNITKAWTTYLQTLAQVRDSNDLALATMDLSNTMQEAVKKQSTEIAGTVGKISPAMMCWLQRSLAESSPCEQVVAAT